MLHVTLRGSDNRIVHCRCRSSFIRIHHRLLLTQQMTLFAGSESDEAPEAGDGAEQADDDQEEDDIPSNDEDLNFLNDSSPY